MPRDYRDYLADIEKSINKIQKYTSNCNQSQFIENELIYDTTVFNLQIIGEASLNIPDPIKENKAWKQSLPDAEYQSLAQEYAVNTFNAAVEAREAIAQQRQQQQKQQKNQNLDLGM